MTAKRLVKTLMAGSLLLGISGCQQNTAPAVQISPQSYETISGTIAIDGNRSTAAGARVGSTFFQEAKIMPLLGRSFINSDLSNGTPVVVLSEKEWREAFHSDPTVIGRIIQIDDRQRTVVGIMPKG